MAQHSSTAGKTLSDAQVLAAQEAYKQGALEIRSAAEKGCEEVRRTVDTTLRLLPLHVKALPASVILDFFKDWKAEQLQEASIQEYTTAAADYNFAAAELKKEIENHLENMETMTDEQRREGNLRIEERQQELSQRRSVVVQQRTSMASVTSLNSAPGGTMTK
eukprot:TRINITY_DN102420_c0_g1_i1.p1 TRINITY_DN102420_c0_g1~~TRINITY_DN102420_c0_g1_i1.p1  ORF type:complete len:181 (+),score=48.36 TRINITY_DN102420_c0_g1_i1:56-544(+)